MLTELDEGHWATIDGILYYIIEVNEDEYTVKVRNPHEQIIVLHIEGIRSVSMR